ncbi:hypothetical protein [Gaoshiqia sediminis]|uniref:Uncharacterized protein n=1 Tax=Gaoshiqia sediminis TaxID=2986998 RepID=A0AA42CB68_9BACT|nr:hypothetical protein [Gaoshiqia sediminis]MCW0484565.1 hypothetical protein [Gaoshiqia sediminis]
MNTYQKFPGRDKFRFLEQVYFYWDNGHTGFGLFNRSTGEQVYPDAVQAIMKALEP